MVDSFSAGENTRDEAQARDQAGADANRDGRTIKSSSPGSLASNKDASVGSVKETSFDDFEASQGLLGSMIAAADQATAAQLEDIGIAPNQVEVDIENLVKDLKSTADQLMAENTNLTSDVIPRELTGFAKVAAKIGEFLTPMTFEGNFNTKTATSGIDVGVNLDDLIGIPGSDIFEAITGKGILETIFGGEEGTSEGGKKSTSKTSASSGRREGTEGGGDSALDRIANFGKNKEGRSKDRKGKEGKELSPFEQFNLLMDEALTLELEKKIFAMPEFQLLDQINSEQS